MARSIGCCLAGAALALVACGENLPTATVRAPEDSPSVTLIRDVAVLDVTTGARLRGRDVLLRDGKIAKIGAASGKVPSGAAVVDGKGGTLVPGLIDMHGHINTSTQPSWEFSFPTPDANIDAYLYAGVTTVLDPGDASSDAFDRRDAIASGERLGPRVYTAGPVITGKGGHPVAMVREFVPGWLAWFVESQVAVQVESEEEASEAVDDIADAGADVVKIAVDRIPLDAPRMSKQTMGYVTARAKERELRVVAHIGSYEDALDAAEAGVSLWVHGPYAERLTDVQVNKLARQDVPMVATLEVFDRYARSGNGPIVPTRFERETVPGKVLASFHPTPDDFELGNFEGWLVKMQKQRGVHAENVIRLRRAGVTVMTGSDTQSGVFPGAGLHRELAQLVAAGMTPTEVIRAATLDPARFLSNGKALEFGVIMEGLDADLLLVEGDPTRDVEALSNLRAVWLDGVLLERTPVTSAGG
jgi:imidazolonepropionase-like amidohydrolase